MPELIPVVLWAWVAYTLWLFRRLPGPAAATAALVGGWLLLPTARYPDSTAQTGFPIWIMPACLPSPVWHTKARVMGLGCLLAVVLFDRERLKGLKPAFCDALMAGWCAVPLLSSSANGLPTADTLSNAAYQSLVWGVPYLMGRLYFADAKGMDVLARGVVAAGLATVPFSLVEQVTGPRFYRALYGFHPYEYDGPYRYVGFRPIVFFEHGNEFGIWAATAALVAGWLWYSGRLRRFLGVPGWAVVGVLWGVSITTQSAGAVVLLFAATAGLVVFQKVNRVWPAAAALVLIGGLVGLRAGNLIDVKGFAERVPVVGKLAEYAARADRGSFAWRLRLEERTTRHALQRPWLGWGRWDWWRPTGERPWGLFTLVLGTDGLIGLALFCGVTVVPLVKFLGLRPPGLWSTPALAPVAALAAGLLVNDVDAILNYYYLTFLLAASGGLVGFRLSPRDAGRRFSFSTFFRPAG